jgi:uncharacterized protein YjbI with pentapeptide repeats
MFWFKSNITSEDFMKYLKKYNLSNLNERKIINKNQTITLENGTNICIKKFKTNKKIELDKRKLHWKNYDLFGINLSGIKLNLKILNFDLQEFNLNTVNLENVELKEAILIRVTLRRANLSCVNLKRADLREADLRDADLRGAILESTNLDRVILERANLEGVNLKDADLIWTNLKGANIKNIILSRNNFYKKNKVGNISLKINNTKISYLENGVCENLDEFHKLHLEKRKSGIIIFIKQQNFEIPIGVLKTKKDKSFLAIKTIIDENNDRIFTTGVVYNLEKKLGEKILKLSKENKGNSLYKYILEENEILQVQTLRPINCKIIDRYFSLIKSLLSDIENNRIKFIELNSKTINL